MLFILNLHVLAQQFINRFIFSSTKEANWLINKGMCVILFDVFKHLLLRETDVRKFCRKSKFLRKKICRNTLALRNKRVQGMLGKNVCFGIIIFSCLSSTKLCLCFLLDCFIRQIKVFYQSLLGNEVDFRDIMNVSPKYLG